jgi:hypothetical protein
VRNSLSAGETNTKPTQKNITKRTENEHKMNTNGGGGTAHSYPRPAPSGIRGYHLTHLTFLTHLTLYPALRS